MVKIKKRRNTLTLDLHRIKSAVKGEKYKWEKSKLAVTHQTLDIHGIKSVKGPKFNWGKIKIKHKTLDI